MNSNPFLFFHWLKEKKCKATFFPVAKFLCFIILLADASRDACRQLPCWWRQVSSTRSLFNFASHIICYQNPHKSYFQTNQFNMFYLGGGDFFLASRPSAARFPRWNIGTNGLVLLFNHKTHGYNCVWLLQTDLLTST